MMCNNPNLDFVNINAYIKLGKNLSVCSKDIERSKFGHKSRSITNTNVQ